MVTLIEYSEYYKEETIERIARFFGLHAQFLNDELTMTEKNYIEAENTLKTWISDDSALYIILYENEPVGFLRIGYRGPGVAWIEDIYIDEKHRSKGIATESILQAEEIVKLNPRYKAISIDVVPRNIEAINLYYKLGYTDLSIITVRKEFYESKRDKKIEIFGKDFYY